MPELYPKLMTAAIKCAKKMILLLNITLQYSHLCHSKMCPPLPPPVATLDKCTNKRRSLPFLA